MTIRFLPAAKADLARIEQRLGGKRPAWRKSARQIYAEAKALLAGKRRFEPVAGTSSIGRIAIPGTFVIVYFRLSPGEVTVLRIWDATGDEEPHEPSPGSADIPTHAPKAIA